MPLNPNSVVARQIERLNWYVKSPDLSIPTRYFSQRDNSREWWRTCNSSSTAMYLNWLQRVTNRYPIDSDEEYLSTVFATGDTTSHDVQTKVLESFGFNTVWISGGTWMNVIDLVLAGFPVPINISHKGPVSAPYGGHVIVIIGLTNDGKLIVNDPWGDLESGYTIQSGNRVRYSHDEVKRRWQGGYRLLANVHPILGQS